MMEFKKGLHYNQEFEQAILGICLLEKEAIGRVYGLIEEEYFYFDSHKRVWSALKKMYQEGVVIDMLTVSDFLQRIRGFQELEATSVPYFVTRLTYFVVTSAHLEYHAVVVKQMWMEREIMRLTSGGKPDGNVQEQIKSINEKLKSLQEKATEHDWQDMTQLMVDLYRHQEKMKETKGIGKPSGIRSLDRENGGFQDGQLIIVGARPSMGKSALVSGMAIEMAKRKMTVGIVSLEMSNTEIAARLAAYDTDTDFNVVYRGLYRDMEETHRLYNKIGKSTAMLPIYVTDKTKVNIPEIRAKAEKLKSLHGLDCLIIDYLQLVSAIGGSYTKNRENEIAEMSRGCKIMAKEMNIPVVLLCQLNREVTKRKGGDRYPQLSDLRESGAIEQDADIVMFLHRDYLMGIEVDENGTSTERQADLVVRKWRNGKSNFIIPLDFDPPKMKFSERGGQTNLVHAVSSPYEKDDKDEKQEMPF
jgi:replicative DNA helicase